MQNKQKINLILTILLVFLLSACSSTEDFLEDLNSDDIEDINNSDVTDLLLSSNCGVRTDLGFRNPQTEASFVQVQVLRSDTAIVTLLDGGRLLIKFHGVTSTGVDGLRVQNGIDLLNQELASGAYFISSGLQCPFTFSDGGAGSLGQLFTLGNQSVNELMIEMGAVVSSVDICDGDQLSQCYQSITPIIVEPEVPEVIAEPEVPVEIITIENDFNDDSSGLNPPCSSLAFGDGRGGDLWLYESESTGTPVYLLNSGWQFPATVEAELTSGGFSQANFTGFDNPDADGRFRPHFRFSRDCTAFTGMLIVRDANQTCEVNLPANVCSRID